MSNNSRNYKNQNRRYELTHNTIKINERDNWLNYLCNELERKEEEIIVVIEEEIKMF